MHQARPFGQAVYGEPLTSADEAVVTQLARRLTNLRGAGALSSLKLVRELPDGGFVIAVDMGGTFRVMSFKPPPEPEPPSPRFPKDYAPMLFSGAVTRALVREGEGVDLTLSEQCRRRLVNYDPEAELPAREQTLQRFVVEYGPKFRDFLPKEPLSGWVYTQYLSQRPTWYSGAMGAVMQIVGGYGKQDLASLPEKAVERAQMVIPRGVRERILRELEGVQLPGHQGVPDAEGQFQYDYRFFETHGVGFDSDEKPWLLRVSEKGVFAMPLPLIPATTTRAFRQYVELQGDEELIAILDRFGGMPSGEDFPKEGDEGGFDAWKRAGVVIEICDAAGFHEHFPYYTGCGWSFNTRGSEGFNTCYDFQTDAVGMQYGLSFKLRLTLAPVPEETGSEDERLSIDPVSADRVSQYLSQLAQTLTGRSEEDRAILYKLSRAPLSDVLARAGGNASPSAERAYWNQLEMSPLAPHAGAIVEVARGNLYHGLQHGVEIKFPDLTMEGCVSHDFRPLDPTVPADPRCDTIMFGYYVEDTLKTVKFFRDNRTGTMQTQLEGDFEECMIVGTWARRDDLSSPQMLGQFYTSDFDDREVAPDSHRYVKIVGKALGFNTIPFWNFHDLTSMGGKLWRNRYFSTETTTTQRGGYSKVVAVCVPFFCPNAVLHAMTESEGAYGESESSGLLGVMADPTSYGFWTYDDAFHWRMPGIDNMNGKPSPVDGNPVWVEDEYYEPYECSDYADQGPWITGLPADFTWLVHPEANDWLVGGGKGGGVPSFQEYYNSDWTPLDAQKKLEIGLMDDGGAWVNDAPDGWYFSYSPIDEHTVFYRAAGKVLFGNTEYGVVTERNKGARVTFGRCALVDDVSPYQFIGVIHE